MLPEGFGSLVDALAAEADLDVRLNATVTAAMVSGGARVRSIAHDLAPLNQCPIMPSLCKSVSSHVGSGRDHRCRVQR